MHILFKLVSQVMRMSAKEWLRSHYLHWHDCVELALKFLFRSCIDSLKLLAEIDGPNSDIIGAAAGTLN